LPINLNYAGGLQFDMNQFDISFTLVITLALQLLSTLYVQLFYSQVKVSQILWMKIEISFTEETTTSTM
jgi:hypothetical protein